ncbi:MAG TPA: cytochrome c oxidase assembly protein [Propionibacteriaceae bacterium]|nr:cytochrome c oxidase assembly protein [Propionibacteriaceae bacterium]
MPKHLGGGPDLLEVLGPVFALIGIAIYLGLVLRGRHRWLRRRCVLWVAGSLAAVAAISGPLARAADTSYVAHMAAHVLLGMLAPLLLVLAAPITLLLRSLPVSTARRVSRVLTSVPIRILTEPGVAAVLSVGGLWLLYTTGLYSAMHRHGGVHLLVHAHLFIAGYLFTAAVISVDPMPHRRSFRHRSAVLVLALAAHDILAKYLYAHPPDGVPVPAAETGAMVMYYGGDAVDVAILVLLGAHWYRATRPRWRRSIQPAGHTLA